nr:integrase, catalytic region, zinc finger, CCHC-type, peptidase aspartic, catalytic [Tanacetum cinerariifolium]
SNSVPTPQESKVVKNDNVIAPGMFRINPSKTSREDKFVPINKVRASIRINLITISQPHVITKKEVNSNLNGLSFTGVGNTAKTKRPQPRRNTKNDRVPSESKSSCIKNKEVEVDEHPRNLPLYNNKIHMSSECNNVKLVIQNDKSEVVYAMCCSNHMTRNLKLLINFIWTFLGIVRFGNDHIAVILGISFLHVFGALCYPKNDRKDIRKLGAKGDIGFFIGYSANSCAYKVYNRRTRKIIETLNVTFDELLTMAFEKSSLKPGLQSMTSRQISSGLDLTYASSKITTQQPTEDTALTPTNSSSQDTNIPNTSQDVDGFETQQQHVQHQPATTAKNVPNTMLDDNTFVNPFATPSTCVVDSSFSQYVDPSNMHTFYQPYPHEYQWTKNHHLE